MRVKAFDGTWTEKYLPQLPCGSSPVFDEESGYAYRCDTCGAVVGSIGMPTDCKEKWETMLAQEKV